LVTRELSFRDFVEEALYRPETGYYVREENRIGPEGDYVTSPVISAVFSFALGRLVREFVSSVSPASSTVVDVGCGDGSLLRSIAAEAGDLREVEFIGIDRSLRRAGALEEAAGIRFAESVDAIPADRPVLVICNELYDALPFARLVRREEGLHELWVREAGGERDWIEKPAPHEYEEYFAKSGMDLAVGQFADISLDWSALHEAICDRIFKGLIVVLDYGFVREKLFDRRIRMYGTAAAYSRQRVHRDLLADPGEQDLTAHVNFSDLIESGERRSMSTLLFCRQAEFLLRLGIAEHTLLQPIPENTEASLADALQLRERREAARRLVLPDGIGQDISVLVQGRGMPITGWNFLQRLW